MLLASAPKSWNAVNQQNYSIKEPHLDLKNVKKKLLSKHQRNQLTLEHSYPASKKNFNAPLFNILLYDHPM